MKKITALFPLTLALSLVMLITSCSQNNELSSDSTESQYEFEDKYDVVPVSYTHLVPKHCSVTAL